MGERRGKKKGEGLVPRKHATQKGGAWRVGKRISISGGERRDFVAETREVSWAMKQKGLGVWRERKRMEKRLEKGAVGRTGRTGGTGGDFLGRDGEEHSAGE